MLLAPGTRLGPYETVSPLGAGGMGEVYRARDSRLGRDVAVTVLPQHLSANAEVRARFEREARTVSSLNYAHICTLHDVGREGDTDYLLMELVEGETLADKAPRRSICRVIRHRGGHMTRRANARLAGFMFLLYIATGIASMVLFNQVTGGAEGTAAKLASIAQHAALVRLTAVLTLLQFVYPVVLAVTLYALTRDQDPDLVLLALCSRFAEGVLASMLLVVALPLQMAGFLRAAGWGSAVTWLMWMPMLVFEVTLALWLIIRGVAMPPTRQSAPAQ